MYFEYATAKLARRDVQAGMTSARKADSPVGDGRHVNQVSSEEIGP